MNCVKPDVWCEDRGWCCGSMSLDLCSLARYTRLCPSADVSVDAGPDKSCSDQSLGSSDTWVRQTM